MDMKFLSFLITFLYTILLSYPEVRAENQMERWQDVTNFIENRNYDNAIDKLKNQLKLEKDPLTIAEIHYMIGYIYFEYKHDYDKAKSAYDEAIDIGTKYPSQEIDGYVILSKMAIANIYRHTGKYDLAIREYKKIAEQYPKTDYAKTALKHVNGIESSLLKIQQYKDIAEKYQDSEFSVGFHLDIAELFLSPNGLNNPYNAIQEYTKIVENFPNSQMSAEALLRIGNIYKRELNNPEKAIETYQKLLDGQFATTRIAAEALFAIGTIYYSGLHDYRKAIDAFNELISNYPTYWKYPACIYWLGLCYEQIKDYDNAIKKFELFINMYPDNKDPVWLADIGRFGEKDVKSKIKSKIDELKIAEQNTLLSKAEQLRLQGRYSQSLAIYHEIMIKYPQIIDKVKAQAEILRYLSEIEVCQEKVARKDEGSPSAQFRIAEIYEQELQDFDKALKEYELITESYPGTIWSAESLFRIGSLYSGTTAIKSVKKNLSAQDYKKAINVYRKLIEEYPKTYLAAEAQYQIAEIYNSKMKDYIKAIEEYEKLINNYPKREFYMGEGYKDSLSDSAQFKIGRIYYEKLRNYDMALEIFKKFINEYPDSCRKASAYAFLAAIYETQKKEDDAIKSLERVIQLISKSNVQSNFFITNSLYEVKRREDGKGISDIRQNILDQIKVKVASLQN